MGDPLFLQRRASVIEKYGRLRHTHPALPADLRDFQVYIWQAAEGRVQKREKGGGGRSQRVIKIKPLFWKRYFFCELAESYKDLHNMFSTWSGVPMSNLQSLGQL